MRDRYVAPCFSVLMMCVKGLVWWIARWVLWLGALVFFLYMGSRWHYVWYQYVVVIVVAALVGALIYYW